MNPLEPLPRGLYTGAFTTGAFTTREAAARGVGKGRLRGRDLQKPFHGIRSVVPLVAVTDRARALQLRMPPGAFFSGVTAALIMGIPLPLRLSKAVELHIGVAAPMRACRVVGAVGHKLQLSPSDLRDWGGLRVTTLARTWCDLASVLDLEDLVAAGDYIIHHRQPLASREELAAAVAAHPGRRGRARLLEALDLLDDRADSPPESVIRVTIVRAGISGLHANYPIWDARGVKIASADLCFPAHRVIFEYQGDYHRTEPERWRKDRTRIARLAAAGWHVIEIAADELRDRHVLLQLIRDALALYPAALHR
ncbi:hypothetical protein [Glaciibacter superstes]|uniref:hypothetical protein n=1 Tax=Glaciibacter superstes TaxID=501023 RepID=UPI0012F8B679|nr:hypothetical protein [Glaciibacter superstes]